MQNLKIKVNALIEGANKLEYLISNKLLLIDVLQKNAIANFILIKKRDKIGVKGKLKFNLRLTCSRCLTEFTKELVEQLDALFLPDDINKKIKKDELSYEDIQTSFYTGEEIDILPLILDTILLSIPMKPLCCENCKGLCPMCGKNLNEGPCECK
ncbi:DUF177 domain-containing protein [candidate division WOR-3 bacterium]|nr:DUF177 domain-containing protein [candidate division WOR-3 bacterium]